MALISIHRIALGVCDEMGDSAQKYLAKYMRYANIIARDLIIYVVPDWKSFVVTSRILPIGSNFLVDLPEDYVSYIKVGICSGGRICLLGVNEDLCGTDISLQNAECSPASTQAITDTCCSGGGAQYPFYNTWRLGQNIGEIYGLSGGNCYPGYFREDKSNNRLILSSDLSSLNGELIVEYKADPTMNGISVVPSECELAIRSGIHWRDNLNKRPSVADMHKNDYQVEYNRLKKLYSSLSADEWRSVFLQATTSTIKR